MLHDHAASIRPPRCPEGDAGFDTGFGDHTRVVPPTTAGMLLAASPPLDDPHFDRTVVYLLAHDPLGGTVGVVLNRPGEAGLARVAPAWRERFAEPAVLFDGGPVAADTLVVVEVTASLGLGEAGSVRVLGEPPDDDALPDGARYRMFRGYSGWTAGQLDAELAAGSWLLLPSRPGDLLCEEPGNLWRTVIARQGPERAWLAEAPDDLRWN